MAGDDILLETGSSNAEDSRLADGIDNDLLVSGDYRGSQPGFNEVGKLTGNSGEDLFVLGQEFPTDTQAVFYDDGDLAMAGIDNYASIADFN